MTFSAYWGMLYGLVGFALQGLAVARQAQRLAFLLRGESFRSPWRLIDGKSSESLKKRYGGTRNQMGPHKRSTCRSGMELQKSIVSTQLSMIRFFESWNFSVDVYAATYNCSNGKPYASFIPSFFKPKTITFATLPQSRSNMLTTMAQVFRMALKSSIKYDYFVSLRIDQFLSGHQRRYSSWTPECFFDAYPRDGNYLEWPNADSVEVTPARYAQQFLDFMDSGLVPRGCCVAARILEDGSGCAVGCGMCAANFMRHLGISEKIISKTNPCMSTAKRSLSTGNDNSPNTKHDNRCIKAMFTHALGEDEPGPEDGPGPR